MANLAQGAVTIKDSYTTDGNNGKKFSARSLTLVLTGQGGLTNKIPASVLALSKIAVSSSAIASDNTIYNTSPSYDGTFLIIAGGDLSKTIHLTVKGNP